MLIILIFALLIFIGTLVVHYRQHFRFYLCTQPSNTSNNSFSRSPTAGDMTQNTMKDDTVARIEFIRKPVKHKRKCYCKLQSIDGEEFDFLPISMCCCIILYIFVCFLLIYRSVALSNDNSPYDTDMILQTKLDYIVVDGIMLLCIWESLFSFYRYYTTKWSVQTFENISLCFVLQRFMLYIIVFIAIYCIYLYLFYWIFPILIVLHCISNIYCNLSFCSILITRYTQFIAMNERCSINNVDETILESVYLMKRYSLIANIISILTLSLFVYICNIEILYYLSIFWSISTFALSMNFVRNRRWFETKICCCINHIKQWKTQSESELKLNTIASTDGDIDIAVETQQNINYDRFNTTTLRLNASQSEHCVNGKSKIKRDSNSRIRRISAHNVLFNNNSEETQHNIDSTQFKKNISALNVPRHTIFGDKNIRQHLISANNKENKSKSYDVTMPIDSVNDEFAIVDDDDDESITPLPTQHCIDVDLSMRTRTDNRFTLKLRRKSLSNPNPNIIRRNLSNRVMDNDLLFDESSSDSEQDNHRSRRLTDRKSAPNTIKKVERMDIPQLNAINSIKKRLKFKRNTNHKNDDRLIAIDIENDVPNLDEMMMSSLHILAKSGFYARKSLESAQIAQILMQKTQSKNRNNRRKDTSDDKETVITQNNQFLKPFHAPMFVPKHSI